MTKPLEQDRSTADLSLLDTISLIIGIVVGVAIFKAPGQIFRNVEFAWQGISAWALGGLLSLMGALCFAELATTYPQSGGAYVYLRRAFGHFVAFLFGWGQLVAMITGSIGALAYVFADYAVDFLGVESRCGVLLAVGSVLVLTATNLVGIVIGKTTQNALTIAKLIGLVAIAITGLTASNVVVPRAVEIDSAQPRFGLAMIFVLFAYGGWSDAAYVTAEVRDRRKNIALALILGVMAITAAYLLVNVALLRGMGFDGLRESEVPAADLLKYTWGGAASKMMSLLVMVSSLGAMNGVIFTGARVYVSLGEDHFVFRKLAKWNASHTAPTWSLLVQAVITLALIFLVGTEFGQARLDQMIAAVGLPALPWSRFGGGFETLVAVTAPIFWLFLLLTIVALAVLRFREPDTERPFRVPLYPLPPLLFGATCVYMLYASVKYAGGLTVLGLLPLALGGFVYALEMYFRLKQSRN